MTLSLYLILAVATKQFLIFMIVLIKLCHYFMTYRLLTAHTRILAIDKYPDTYD